MIFPHYSNTVRIKMESATETFSKLKHRCIAPCNPSLLSDFISLLAKIGNHKLTDEGLLTLTKLDESIVDIVPIREQEAIAEQIFLPTYQRPTEKSLTQIADHCIRFAKEKKRLKDIEKKQSKEKKEEDTNMAPRKKYETEDSDREEQIFTQCFASKRDKSRCTNKPVKGTKLCATHKTSKIHDWEKTKEQETLEQTFIRASLNGVFYLPGTTYRLDKDQYVISRDTFLATDKFDVAMNPLNEQDIAFLTQTKKKFKIIDWENRIIQDIPKEEILKDFTIPQVPKTIFKQKKERTKIKPFGEDSDLEEPDIPDIVYEKLRDL
jgi:hypothetical protein